MPIILDRRVKLPDTISKSLLNVSDNEKFRKDFRLGTPYILF